MSRLRLVLLGPPGAGKGTQASNLAAHLGVPHISTGDMFREAAASGTELGALVSSYMESGGLVPDDVTISVVRRRLSLEDCGMGFILDGFPRTLPQARALDETLEEMDATLDAVVNISVPDEVLVRRSSGRRTCSRCGRTYHLEYDPPEREGLCDDCGGELVHRSDDREETVLQRLHVYGERTAPLVDYYRSRSLLRTVDGDSSIDEVFERIRSALEAAPE